MPPSDPIESHEAQRDPIEIRQEDERKDSSVRCVLVTTRKGKTYHLHRDDFKAWIFDQKQNMRPNEAARDPVTSRETSEDFTRPRQTSRDPVRSREVSSETDDIARDLREENMQLKIDVEVRRQLLNQAAGEIGRQRGQIEELLRENGALDLRVLQLSSPSSLESAQLPPPASHHVDPDVKIPEGLFDISNSPSPDPGGQ